MNSRLTSRALLIAACLFSAAVSAETPRDVADLVGARAAGAESALQDRGFVHIKTQKSSDRSWSNWWNPSRRECLSVVTMNGRYDSIISAPALDCNQSGSAAAGKDDSNANAAAAAIGIAALIGVVALAHNSQHHEDGQHYSDNNNESEFERGHRDGLYNEHYDNHNNTDAYAKGYTSGVEQRDHETSYREHSGRYDRGYVQQVAYSDLQGARGSSADSALTDRGFRNVDGFKEMETAYTIWYNRSSGQCLQMAVSNGRVVDLAEIGHNPGCR